MASSSRLTGAADRPLRLYGIPDNRYSGDAEMFLGAEHTELHRKRQGIITQGRGFKFLYRCETCQGGA
jgi:hypothetical protein